MKNETLKIAIVLALSVCLLFACNSARYTHGDSSHNRGVDNKSYRGY
ncbi:MAG: hypothetical protein ABI691_06285 [Ginsengibacter sp.]